MIVEESQLKLAEVQSLLRSFLQENCQQLFLQKYLMSDANIEVQIKISQHGRQIIQAGTAQFTECPCKPRRHRHGCVHSIDANGNPTDC